MHACHSGSYTSCRNLKVASPLGTLENWFPSRYLEQKFHKTESRFKRLTEPTESIMSKLHQITAKTGLPLQKTKK